MIQLNENLKAAIIVLLLASYVIYEQKPDLMFKEDGSFKSFGVRHNETPFPFFIVITILGFTVYYGLLLKGGNYI
tara:strand:+ start:1118 stop:1342 length:225 start_codon:yes stop_codon:yes gene_type:complete